MNEIDLKQAIVKCQQSFNEAAFRIIYDNFCAQLYYTCLRYLKNESDAQDVLQETFITVADKITDYKNKGSFGGWISRIAINKCLQKIKEKRKNIIEHQELNETAEYVENEEDKIDKEVTEQFLLNSLNELPIGYKTIINLSVLEGYSHREIAELLDISESTSRSQLTRAKSALKKILAASSIIKESYE